ncbi:MAG: hypothetical protein QF699_05380, partial [Candidatus Poseidoniaceae archaeon]|nr:hypothetical protein [Candidatus Poseidoniaceae archaeon]
MAEPMDYASAGVDIDLEGSAVASLIASLSGSTRKPGTPGAPVHLPGGFGGLIEFGDSLLALATDGLHKLAHRLAGHKAKACEEEVWGELAAVVVVGKLLASLDATA